VALAVVLAGTLIMTNIIARFQTPLGRKLRFTLLGDVGGFGEGSKLEWQVLPVLGYELNRRFTLQAAIAIWTSTTGAADSSTTSPWMDCF
jgi:hypothetical protein